jgi:hypothetical protein
MTGELMDDPNRQAVGLEPAWVEGTGGTGVSEPEPEPTKSASYRTKAELLDEALAAGLDVDDSMTKAEIEAALAG